MSYPFNKRLIKEFAAQLESFCLKNFLK